MSYSVVQVKSLVSPVKITVYVEGRVTLCDWDKLQILCLDSLKASDHLALNLKRVGDCDFSLGVLVCLLRRTAQLLGKRVTVYGKKDESFICVYKTAEGVAFRRCNFTAAGSSCLWNRVPLRHAAGVLMAGWTPLR